MRTIQSIRLDNFLSFGPGTEWFDLSDLNVLIGPNGAGKSNVVEAFELLHAATGDFAAAIRDGGGAQEWLWKGNEASAMVTLETTINTPIETLGHQLAFSVVGHRVEIADEVLRKEPSSEADGYLLYRTPDGTLMRRMLMSAQSWIPGGDVPEAGDMPPLSSDQSILSQYRAYITLGIGGVYSGIQTFREWTFGRYTHLRQPQRADLPEDRLLPDASNLPLILLRIEHADGRRFNELLKLFLPRFERMSTLVSGNTVQFFLHEQGLSSPLSAARLSDGTLRFIAILATLLNPTPPRLVCIEEPELGVHPDALAIIADLLVEASSRMQIIVTTHSDALVSALTNHPDAIVACEKPKLGTTLRRLDPQQLRDWLREYRLGDLWRMGEIGANL